MVFLKFSRTSRFFTTAAAILATKWLLFLASLAPSGAWAQEETGEAAAGSKWADWSLSAGIGSYFGDYQVGVAKSFRQHHDVGFVFGHTPDRHMGGIRQYTFDYGYTPWFRERGVWLFRPLTVGAFATFTDHREFFFKSDEAYHEDGYYDITQMRLGLRASTAVGRPWAEGGGDVFLSFDVSLLDQGILALFNNGIHSTMLDFMSPGFSLVMTFH